jgi:photosystem I P700 chlorophyll a apoprotein A1
MPSPQVTSFQYTASQKTHRTVKISDKGVVTHITGGNFAQSSITINGWLRYFLWAQACQVWAFSLMVLHYLHMAFFS